MVLESDFQLGDWLVKPHTNTIEGPEGETHLEPKAMQVLALLAERPGEVVGKKEILKDVWDGTFVSDEVLPNAIWELRKALGDDARKPTFIQTLPKKGYRVIAPVSHPLRDAQTIENARRLHGWRARLTPVAAIVAAILVGMFVVRRHDSRGAATSDAVDSPHSVLVMSFENHTATNDLAWLSSGVPTMLRTGLAEVSGLRVVSAQREDQVRSEIGNDESRQTVARRAGAEAVVVGSIFKLGEEYRIDVQVEDVADARILAAHSVRGGDVFKLMDDLTLWVRDSLGPEGASAAAPVPAIRDITTSSLEAFRLYTAGVNARRNYRLGDARRLLTEAIETDPGFALAYLELQWIAMISKDTASYDLFHAKMLEYQDHLPPHRRQLLEANELWKVGPERAESILLDVIARRPDEEEAYLQLSHRYQSSFQPEKARDILERGTKAVPHSGYLRLNYGYQLLRDGRYPEAIHQFETYARIQPEEANPWDSLGEAYLIAGIPERALEEYAHALDVDDKFANSNLGRAWAFSQMGRFDEALDELGHIRGELPPGYSPAELFFLKAYLLSRAGRYRAARAQLGQISELAEKLQSPTLTGIVHLFEALLSIERDEPEKALTQAEAARAILPPNDGGLAKSLEKLTELLLGIAASRTEDANRAHQHLNALQELYEPRDPRERWWYHVLLGETLLARNDAKGAYTAFTKGEPVQKMSFNVTQLLPSLSGGLSFRDGAARAKALDGNAEEAIAIYEKLLRPDISLMWTAPLEPRYHIALARLHRERGEREQASKHYRRFLELWSRADSDLPELAEAQAYLASS